MVEKYLPLQAYLIKQNKTDITISLADIESMVGELPRESQTHQFWANTKHHLSRRNSWLEVYYKAFFISEENAVRFEYVGPIESLRSTIQKIAAGWSEYKKDRVINASNVTGKLVTEEFPSLLKKWGPADAAYIYFGSAGQGNISAAPWIAIFDPRLTTTAQNGYYPVYLFSTDLSRIYLSFALGVTQFDQQFGENKTSIEKMRNGAERIRHLCQTLRRPDELHQTSIDLTTSNGPRRYQCYEAATILAYSAYNIEDLPSDEKLIDDFLGIMDFYQTVAEDPIMPDVSDLVDSVTPIEETTEFTSYKNFEPRPKTVSRKSSSRKTNLNRRSKDSKKVGDAGELFVLEKEKKRLVKAGRSDLANKVDHLAARHETPGWDITSFDEDGNEIYIEVKSSKGNTINSVELTKNEWEACSEKSLSGRYYIYLVTNALSSNRNIEILNNPNQLVASKILEIKPSVYELSLRNLE
ncbi:MAG: DUF3578 domain-containing protein [Hyphomicrobiales bacterium]